MSNADLIPFRDQLMDYPGIKELFTTVPKNMPPPVSPAWIVYGRKEGRPWGSRQFDKYRDAFVYVKPRLKEYHDISITCKRKAFSPPTKVVKLVKQGRPLMVKSGSGKMVQATKAVPIKPPINHLWCMYCRRFSIFTWFTRHHAFRGDLAYLLDPSVRRCMICGTRESSGAYRG